jgi:hypothetical protein
MASTITAGNATNGLALSCDNTGILELKTGTGSGTTAMTLGSAQAVALLAAGTATVAPLDFTAGTNLTTPIAGAMEYDGRVFYATPQGTQRGVVPGAQFFRLDAGLAGANVNTAQSVLGVGVTLSASTVYAFEGFYALSKTAGATSHSVGLGFGGSATVNNIIWTFSGYDSTSTTTSVNTSQDSGYVTSVSNTTVSRANASATMFNWKLVRGTVSVNAGGTFIPQYTLSAAPGGAYTTVAGSYFMIYPIGASGANTSVGTWA